MPLPSPTISGRVVEYRQPILRGEIVVQVHLTLTTPRFCAFAQMWDVGVQPITLFIDDILAYAEDARKRVPSQVRSTEVD